MKKRKIVFMVLACMFSVFALVGCTKEEAKKDDTEEKVESTIATTLQNQFKEEMKNEKDIEVVAKKLSENKILQISLDVAEVKEDDYLSGFKTEIKGFKKAVVMRPFVGTIPFVAYLFEVEDAEIFSQTLKDNADLAWNICTEADEMKTEIVDNYVFFIMSPKNFEEE